MFSPELFDEYTRRQYVAKAPERNPFGTDEVPANFNELDIFTKVSVPLSLLPSFRCCSNAYFTAPSPSTAHTMGNAAS